MRGSKPGKGGADKQPSCKRHRSGPGIQHRPLFPPEQGFAPRDSVVRGDSKWSHIKFESVTVGEKGKTASGGRQNAEGDRRRRQQTEPELGRQAYVDKLRQVLSHNDLSGTRGLPVDISWALS